ncbi:glutamate-cysteine ligase family protein [Rhodohalobacter halophilus]|uniref:glutamate-cysteine ligase family protein n=1 Tax=Rhodohalobacter halophilus TaxID=1812810 RepID=UPI00083FB348|nr:glutamate-cysteine ligase family protein [Rhodohalobacter halophilus]
MSVTINQKRPLHLFEGFGVELEYAIVRQDSLDIYPIADKVLEHQAGKIVNEVALNGLAWSNELVLHVIELKTNGPVTELVNLGTEFQKQVSDINSILSTFEACLMPGAMHPWMNPLQSVELWPHEYNPIYEAYNRIFNCSGHGWSNLQSTHLNLPFYGDDEFAKLHAALRIVLPLIPAMAASSPIADAQRKPFLNYRMEAYRTNSLRIPSITGLIVPEAIFTRDDYQSHILDKMYRDISPYDTDEILQEEWLNSRGLMPRWDRNAIEVRVMDIQEFPGADLAILEWIVALTKAFVNEVWSSHDEQKNWGESELYPILLATIEEGERAVIEDRRFLKMFGMNRSSMKAGEICPAAFQRLKEIEPFSAESDAHLDLIFREGTLANRILNSLPKSFNRRELQNTYHQLCNSLQLGKAFIP